MPDIENVIKGLKYLHDVKRWSPNESEESITARRNITGDALALLKAHEPRVMTLDDVKLASENAEPVCVETADGELRWALTYPGIEPPKEGFRYPGGVLFDAVDVNDEIYDGDFYGMTMPDGRPHGLGWRAWTSRPDQATREAAKWDE